MRVCHRRVGISIETMASFMDVADKVSESSIMIAIRLVYDYHGAVQLDRRLKVRTSSNPQSTYTLTVSEHNKG